MQPAIMWLTISWALPQTLQLPSICFFKILCWWYLVLNDRYWAAMIKISVSPLSPALINQAQLASLSIKGFSRLQKNYPCIVFSHSSSILSFSMLSFSITFTGVGTVDKGKYLFFIAFASFRRIFCLPSFIFYRPAKPVFTLLNIITQIDRAAAVSRQQLNNTYWVMPKSRNEAHWQKLSCNQSMPWPDSSSFCWRE